LESFGSSKKRRRASLASSTTRVVYNVAKGVAGRTGADFFEFTIVEQPANPLYEPKLRYREQSKRRGLTVLRSQFDDPDALLLPAGDPAAAAGSTSTSVYNLCVDATRASNDQLFTLAVTRKTVPQRSDKNDEDDLFANRVPQDRMGSSAGKISRTLNVAMRQLYSRRELEHASREEAEANFELVNKWSTIQVVVMLVTGMVQLIMIKSLFEERSVIRSLLLWFT
jgi:hypothetical protein